MQVVANRPHHHFPGVEAHAHARFNPRVQRTSSVRGCMAVCMARAARKQARRA